MTQRFVAPEKVPDISDRWVRSEEAARYLGVEVTTLAKWRQQGAGPAYSCALGRDPRYRLSLLEAFMTGALVANSTQARFLRSSQRQERVAGER